MKLANKVVVVTGAGNGIGRATALAFARAGARIAACDIDRARLDALAAELGDRALLVEQVDVADRGQMQAFATAVHARVPAADIIVNNAGVAVAGTFLDTSLDDWDWLLGINLRGVVHGCHFFIPNMVARGAGGHVINLSSILGIFAPPGATAYIASKFAVLGLSQSLRAELAAHHIGVTAICPGMIATGIIADGRINGAARERQPDLTKVFKKATPATRVASVILEAVRTNPAVRTVGPDAWGIAQLARMAPRATARIGALVAKRMERRT